jgi:hypothetical protein
MQQKIAALCYYRFLPHVHYGYANALEYLKLHTSRKRRYHLDALFLIQVYRGLKYCPSLLEAVGLRVPTRYLGNFSMFNFSPSLKNCPSARCASAANVVCRNFDALKKILFPLVIFYNNCGAIHILDTNYIQLYKFPDLVSCLFVFVLHVFFFF